MEPNEAKTVSPEVVTNEFSWNWKAFILSRFLLLLVAAPITLLVWFVVIVFFMLVASGTGLQPDSQVVNSPGQGCLVGILLSAFIPKHRFRFSAGILVGGFASGLLTLVLSGNYLALILGILFGALVGLYTVWLADLFENRQRQKRQHMETSARITAWAIASFSLSCLGVILSWLGCIPGIICGHVARAQCRKSPNLGGAGLALAGLTVGYIVLALHVAFLVGSSQSSPFIDELFNPSETKIESEQRVE